MDIAQGANFLKNYASTVASDLMRTDFQALQQIAEMILATKKTGSRIYIAGNGGSAATASHMANDLLKGARRFGREGFSVALISREQGNVDRIADSLGDAGITAAGFAADRKSVV